MIVKICETAQFTRATPGSSLVKYILPNLPPNISFLATSLLEATTEQMELRFVDIRSCCAADDPIFPLVQKCAACCSIPLVVFFSNVACSNDLEKKTEINK